MDGVTLVTGGSGYVGGRLTAKLQASGHRVRCLARRPAGLRARFGPALQLAEGDVLDPPSPGDKKINVIKVVREVTSLGLKEAKDLVEGAPAKVKEGVSKQEAADVKKKFEDAGAKVRIA